jgi:hypothetical protein
MFDTEIDKYWRVLDMRMSKFIWQLKSEFPDLEVKTYGEDVFGESKVLCHIHISSPSCPNHSLRLSRKKIIDTNNMLNSLSEIRDNASALPIIKQLYERAMMLEYDEEVTDLIEAFDASLRILYKETSEDVFQSMCVCRRVYTGYQDRDDQVTPTYRKILDGLGLYEFELTSRETINNFVRDCKRIEDEMSARVSN